MQLNQKAIAIVLFLLNCNLMACTEESIEDRINTGQNCSDFGINGNYERFLSTVDLEVGADSDGVILGKWELTFVEDKTFWLHSDTVETLEYSCNGEMLLIGGTEVLVTKDAQNNIITIQMNGVKYEKESL